nr:hypothetical protein [uncultured Draconibacterium sp.]
MKEKLFGAVYNLVGSSSLKVRLIYAYGDIAYIPEETVPFEIKKQFRDVMQPIRVSKAHDVNGKIKKAVGKMTIADQRLMAQMILGMYSTLSDCIDLER